MSVGEIVAAGTDTEAMTATGAAVTATEGTAGLDGTSRAHGERSLLHSEN